MPKPVRWIGSSRQDIAHFPTPVRRHIGIAIYQAQPGGQHRAAKRLKGFGPGILEIVARHDGDTYRGVYTVRFQSAIYVLHAFQKKSRSWYLHTQTGARPYPPAPSHSCNP